MTPPRFSPQSQRDLNDIGDYIAKDSPQNAARFVARLEQHCELIAQQPLIGRIRDEVRPGLRSFGFGRYVIFYRPIAESAELCSKHTLGQNQEADRRKIRSASSAVRIRTSPPTEKIPIATQIKSTDVNGTK